MTTTQRRSTARKGRAKAPKVPARRRPAKATAGKAEVAATPQPVIAVDPSPAAADGQPG